ncbi:hypothetical protein [Crateriforma spongiae]|uniref:hypothetical protein n=1 Tax=Crateriforma spongiae TaxID=2724528 RepID=UPI0014484175|nr:hypothetical protein [Crateriforma spongiae]
MNRLFICSLVICGAASCCNAQGEQASLQPSSLNKSQAPSVSPARKGIAKRATIKEKLAKEYEFLKSIPDDKFPDVISYELLVVARDISRARWKDYPSVLERNMYYELGALYGLRKTYYKNEVDRINAELADVQIGSKSNHCEDRETVEAMIEQREKALSNMKEASRLEEEIGMPAGRRSFVPPPGLDEHLRKWYRGIKGVRREE